MSIVSAELIDNILNGVNNLLEILGDQGYDVAAFSNKSVTEISFMFTTDQLNMLIRHLTSAKKVFVAFHLKHTLRDIDAYIEEYFMTDNMLSPSKDWLIIVVKERDVKDTVRTKLCQAWDEHGYFITVLRLPRLQYNVLKHKYVPPHKILTDRETDEVRERYCIKKDTEFCEISRFDAAAEAIGIRPGQVCHIKRDSSTAIESDHYRFCINK